MGGGCWLLVPVLSPGWGGHSRRCSGGSPSVLGQQLPPNLLPWKGKICDQSGAGRGRTWAEIVLPAFSHRGCNYSPLMTLGVWVCGSFWDICAVTAEMWHRHGLTWYLRIYMKYLFVNLLWSRVSLPSWVTPLREALMEGQQLWVLAAPSPAHFPGIPRNVGEKINPGKVDGAQAGVHSPRVHPCFTRGCPGDSVPHPPQEPQMGFKGT